MFKLRAATPRSKKMAYDSWVWRLGYTVAGAGIIVFLAGLYAAEFQQHYGFALFVALPIVAGFSVVMIYGGVKRLGLREACILSTLPLLIGGSLLTLMGFEGFICLAMAMVPMLALAVIGGLAALALDHWVRRWKNKRSARLGCTALPVAALFLGLPLEPSLIQRAPTRMVQSEVIIHGPIASVWETVIAFPDITAEPGGIFAWGIAYPLAATMEGHGVGAVRHCTFTTGDFVEPITVWDAPYHLAFEVAEQPIPMREWSFYGDIDTPHLHGFMVSERGEFRLEEGPGGTVRLRGTSWYHYNLWPNFYWGWISDRIIHQIHGRVLGHIKAVVESAPGEDLVSGPIMPQ